jgi:hypothetical protein
MEYHIHTTPPVEDSQLIVGGLIPEAKAPSNDCIFEDKKICAAAREIKLMKEYLVELGFTPPTNDNDVLNMLKKELGVETESAIWENREFQNFVGYDVAKSVLKDKFKPLGPANSTELLNNENIDDELEQWSLHGQELFGKKFKHIPFQMIDFMKTGTELSRTNLKDLIKKGYDCFGVVLNTDITAPDHYGKHWFCLYGDLQHKGTPEDPYVIEFFNSSGNPPMQGLEIWLQKAIHDLKRDTKQFAKIHRSIPKRIQLSETECGVWSLMYIKSRLESHPIDWFYTVKADDQDMIDMRKHLFRKK